MLTFLGHTSKLLKRINKKRTFKSHLRVREKWLRLNLRLFNKLSTFTVFNLHRHDGKNVISIDETAWRVRSDKKKGYWPKGY